jgi:hypothetical protein
MIIKRNPKNYTKKKIQIGLGFELNIRECETVIGSLINTGREEVLKLKSQDY